ncbi:hypothetical protein [Azospira inquinata]|uniref:Uncharacterized protein n=1 Tax=Azospira inquinata TaxID=2785627 RepID=A0A975SN65_9RHOO|nr:hypothetical protein [Azospira inquinata]QWT45726.1 hypothetical protein J8L76_12430 [Azospira inquinata]QWT48950.1 hypothetical protein Azoinq_14180 [Azospira inquinata]
MLISVGCPAIATGEMNLRRRLIRPSGEAKESYLCSYLFNWDEPLVVGLMAHLTFWRQLYVEGKNGHHPLRRLFLKVWQTYEPPRTATQAITLEKFLTYLDEETEYDRQYDEFISVLFPETRHLLR